MCRLLGFASRTPTTLTDLLSEDELQGFVELSRKHCDGWGYGWATDRGVEVARVPEPAHASPAFVQVSQEHRSDLAIAHVRWATDDLAIDLNNTHPFTDGRVAFAHNGAIRPADALDAIVPGELLAELQGTTDSERYFLAFRDRARRTDPANALAEVVSTIDEGGYDYTCLNVMLATDTELVVVNRFKPEAELLEGPEYYRLNYRVTPDAVVVASTGFGSGWRMLENGQMLVVQRHTLEIDVRNIDEMVPTV